MHFSDCKIPFSTLTLGILLEVLFFQRGCAITENFVKDEWVILVCSSGSLTIEGAYSPTDDCKIENPMPKVLNLCVEGESLCEFSFDSDNFGNPCWFIDEELTIVYSCVIPTTEITFVTTEPDIFTTTEVTTILGIEETTHVTVNDTLAMQRQSGNGTLTAAILIPVVIVLLIILGVFAFLFMKRHKKPKDLPNTVEMYSLETRHCNTRQDQNDYQLTEYDEIETEKHNGKIQTDHMKSGGHVYHGASKVPVTYNEIDNQDVYNVYSEIGDSNNRASGAEYAYADIPPPVASKPVTLPKPEPVYNNDEPDTADSSTYSQERYTSNSAHRRQTGLNDYAKENVNNHSGPNSISSRKYNRSPSTLRRVIDSVSSNKSDPLSAAYDTAENVYMPMDSDHESYINSPPVSLHFKTPPMSLHVQNDADLNETDDEYTLGDAQNDSGVVYEDVDSQTDESKQNNFSGMTSSLGRQKKQNILYGTQTSESDSLSDTTDSIGRQKKKNLLYGPSSVA